MVVALGHLGRTAGVQVDLERRTAGRVLEAAKAGELSVRRLAQETRGGEAVEAVAKLLRPGLPCRRACMKREFVISFLSPHDFEPSIEP